MCVLEINEADMERRIILERDDGWRKYIHQFGNSNIEIVNYYKEQQELLLGLCKKTKLEWLKISTSETSVDEMIPQVIAFWNI